MIDTQQEARDVPQHVKDIYRQSSQYFPTPIQQFQFFDKYSRFDWGTGRRETWAETVQRSVDFLRELSENRLEDAEYDRIHDFILSMRAMPSMRLLAMAGPAARRQNLSIYNCSYIPVDSLDSFVEALLISMSGCGVGYSVERKYINLFPNVIESYAHWKIHHVVEDTTEGWADALRVCLESAFNGVKVSWDFSKVRPAGSILKVKGGRASGPEPLRDALERIYHIITSRAVKGGRLRPIDAHDIMCLVGNAAVSGGMRRTAMLCLFDYSDEEMLHCKDGDFAIENPQRWNANNSVVLPTGGLRQDKFMKMFADMIDSERGEPGFFSRENAERLIPERRKGGYEWGCNPCAEIILRPRQLCNLSIAVARREDTLEDLVQKVHVATLIGCIQSMATNFPGMRKEWKQNAIDERLLGVDITGQLDCHLVQQEWVMQLLKDEAKWAGYLYSQRLGINMPAAITTVKPSGNSAQLLNVSSGLHPRWSRYYIRNVRVSATSPICAALRDNAVPVSPENGQTHEDATTYVVSFPIQAPAQSVIKSERSAIEQCEYWLRVRQNYTEHNPSVTITYKHDEVIDLTRWVWDHRSDIIGMSFLPEFDAQYDQLPYIEITKEEYERRVQEFPEIDFSRIYAHEQADETTAAQELACFAGVCEIL